MDLVLLMMDRGGSPCVMLARLGYLGEDGVRFRAEEIGQTAVTR